MNCDGTIACEPLRRRARDGAISLGESGEGMLFIIIGDIKEEPPAMGASRWCGQP